MLVFDPRKYQLVKELKTDIEGTKPALFALLQDQEGNQFIVGSIHLPGGAHDNRGKILECVTNLQPASGQVPFVILGDFNHTAEDTQD